jgi:hypothetical protein
VAELSVQSWFKPMAWPLWAGAIHDAFSLKWSRNVFERIRSHRLASVSRMTWRRAMIGQTVLHLADLS